jgi:hypothetical protein
MVRGVNPQGEVDASVAIGLAIVKLLSNAADAWADGDVRSAEQLARAGWRLVGTATFVDGNDDCEECE